MDKVLSELISDFQSYLRFERRLSDDTIQSYQTDLKQLSDYLKVTYDLEDATAIKVFHLRSWLSEMKTGRIGNRSLKRKASACSSFFKYLMREEIAKVNPAAGLLLPKGDKPLPRFLEEKETRRLFEDIDFPDDFQGKTDRLILEILYDCGLRRAELINLKEEDVHFSRKEIQVLGKGNKIRLIPIGKGLMERIKEYLDLKRKLFENPTKNLLILLSGKQLYPNYVYRVVEKYLSKVTTMARKNPHLFRHTFASQILNNGGDLMSIKELLGHSSLAATEVYTHLNIDRLKEVYKKAHPKGE